MNKNNIYLDHAATTPVGLEVFEAMQPYFSEKFGNSSSLHSFGQDAVEGVDKARDIVAKFLGCTAQEVIFTSGATEANNMVIQGVIRASSLKKPHVITSQVEHPAVLEVVRKLEKEGQIEATYVGIGQDGVVSVEEVSEAIRDNTVLVSIMYVNNEIGTIQPIRDIGKMIEKKNKDREVRIYFHTDAVQALNYLGCNVDYLHVDLLSLSGHKIYAPKGIGVLYSRVRTDIQPIQEGGHQEYGLRPGTLNTPAIVGLGKAIELIDREKNTEKITKLRDQLLKGVTASIPDVEVNGEIEKMIPGTLNLSFKNTEGESSLLLLDMEGVAISTGSACASGSLEASHVLLSLGKTHLQAHSSIRFS